MTKPSHCPREEEFATPAGERRSADQKAHLATCALCTEVEEAAVLLRSAAAGDRGDRLPDPSVIWRRQYLEEQLAERRRRHRPVTSLLRGAQRSTSLIVVSGLALLASHTASSATQLPGVIAAAAVLATAFITSVLHGIRE